MELLRILEPDETGLGRIVFNGRFYGVPVEVLEYLGEFETNVERLTDQNKRLVEALKAVKPIMVRVSKTSLERVPVYPADEIDAILAEVKGGEE